MSGRGTAIAAGISQYPIFQQMLMCCIFVKNRKYYNNNNWLLVIDIFYLN